MSGTVPGRESAIVRAVDGRKVARLQSHTVAHNGWAPKSAAGKRRD